jgi:hypothetical protein
MWIDRIDHAVLMLRDIPAPALSTIGSLRHSPGIIALVPLARERRLEKVYVPALDAREPMLLAVLAASWRGAPEHGSDQPVTPRRAVPRRATRVRPDGDRRRVSAYSGGLTSAQSRCDAHGCVGV